MFQEMTKRRFSSVVSPIEVKGINMSLQAGTASGKTRLALSAPYPLVAFCYDPGWERAVFGAGHEIFDGLDIMVYRYERDTKVVKSQWDGHDLTLYIVPKPPQIDALRVLGFRQQWSWFRDGISAALTDDYIQSVVVDTMTVGREVKADANLQAYQESPNTAGRTQLQQLEYGKVHDALRDIYQTFQGNKNLIATHHLADEYVRSLNDKGEEVSVPSGRRILKGMSDTEQWVDVALLLEGRVEKGQFTVDAEFLKSGYVPELKGTHMTNPTWDSMMQYMALRLGNRLQFPLSKRVVVRE